MKLVVSVPEGIETEGMLYALPYDINQSSHRVHGHCIVTREQIVTYIDETKQEEFKLSDYDEFLCEQLTGCCMLLAKKDEKTRFICAFTNTHFLRYAEMAKLLNYYRLTGEAIETTDADEPACPTCGLPLDGAKTCPYCAKKSATLWRLVKRTAPYKTFFIASVVATICANLINVFIPFLQRAIIDDYIVPLHAIDRGFLVLAASMILLLCFNWLFDFVNMKASSTVALCLGRDLRQELFEKTQRLSMSSVSKRTPGDLINRVNRDAARLQDFITANGKEAIVRIFNVIILTVLLFALNPLLALMVIIPVPFVLLFVNKLFTTMRIRYGRAWRLRTRYSSLLHDILNGIKEVKSYGNERREIERYEDASERWMKSCIAAEIVWNLTMPFVWFILTLGNYLVLYFGGTMVLKQEMSLGALVQYTTYVSMMYAPLIWLIQIPRLLADTTVSAARVFEIIDEVDDIKDKEDAVSLDVKGDITFEHVFFGYKVYNPVLKDISCHIKAGEMVGIVGHSGVGKSTMINLIMRLYDCTGGRILIDGIDIRDISQESLRSQVGVVLQETFLFDGSVLDNIRYSKPDASFQDIIRAAKIANAHDFITKLPDGYNTKVGNKGFSLSGGERQRIAIARAILHDPKILILDEATASLDTETEKQIQEALNRLTKGRTTIAIAHRLSTLSNADRLIVLDRGKLAETGSHHELIEQKGVYYKLVMAQRQTAKLRKTIEATIE